MADLVLQVGQSSTGTVVPFLADGVTSTPGATVANQVWTISDPALTIVNNPDGTVGVTGIAATATPAQGTVSAQITDEDGTVGQFTATFTITVGGVTPPVNRTASIGVSWSSPQ